MSKDISAIDFEGRGTTITIDKEPDYCPYCHKYLSPARISSYFINTDLSFLQSIYRCPSNECRLIYLANYRKISYYYNDNNYHLLDLYPSIPEDPKIPENVKSISSFYNIYKQATHAESYNLNEICGMGYRKALEFLIKEFTIKRADKLGITDTSKISQSTQLGKLINDYIDDHDIKEAAKRAAWLGNDETHYYKKWVDKDLNDLKLLLTLTIGFINNKLTLEKYMKEMESKSEKGKN